MAITFTDGLWRNINAALETTFDQWEAVEVSALQAERASELILQFLESHYVAGEVRRTIGSMMAPESRTLEVRETSERLQEVLRDLALFFAEAAMAGVSVTASL
jgi:hypothetical protein